MKRKFLLIGLLAGVVLGGTVAIVSRALACRALSTGTRPAPTATPATAAQSPMIIYDEPVPPHWGRRSFNGMRFYIVPLEAQHRS